MTKHCTHAPAVFLTFNELLILQWNCNGIKNKLTELTQYLYKHQLKIAVIQESKLNCNSSPPDIPNFTTVRKDRLSDKGGGLIIYIHKTLQFQMLPDFHLMATQNH